MAARVHTESSTNPPQYTNACKLISSIGESISIWLHFFWETSLTSKGALHAIFGFSLCYVLSAAAQTQSPSAPAPAPAPAAAPGRFEYFDDNQGFSTGDRQAIKEFTATYEYKWLAGLLTRAEYRRDRSTYDYFHKGNPEMVGAQSTLTVACIAFFGPKR
jgi:hypothetical protein